MTILSDAQTGFFDSEGYLLVENAIGELAAPAA